MWKFVTRGIRESIERRACRTNIYSQSSQDGNNNNNESKKLVVCEKKFGVPSFSAFYHCYCGNTKHLGPKDKESKNKYDAKYTWSDAVGWSSVLAVGYVLCQSLCIRRKLFELDNVQFDQWKNKIIINSKNQASHVLSYFLLPQPKYILPVSKKFIKPESVDEFLIDNAVNIQQPYGPITADEAFEEAVNQFTHTHETVMGDLELDFGSKAIEEKRYEDAFEHFEAGAKFSSLGSLFNLGLCYELGLGTTMDHTKAVEYYKMAANKGHIDAKYNLGVFHAQGKGGLPIDINAARQLFEEAAEKGHSQAQKALQLEKSFKERLNFENKSKYRLEVKTVNSKARDSFITKLMNYNILMTDSNNESPDIFINQYNNIESQNATDKFLEMLNIHERSAIPLISVGESGP